MYILIFCGLIFLALAYGFLPPVSAAACLVLCAIWLFYRGRTKEEISERDKLTGLLIRRPGEELFQKLFEIWQRYVQQPLSVIIIDGDGLKKVNDTHGHECGDLMIARLGNICRDGVRRCDVAYRMGGEEFVVVCPNTSLAQAAILAETLRQKLDTAIEFRGQQIKVSASLGVAQAISAAHQSFADLLSAADGALYQAKAAGKNRVVTAGT
ncbi:MAG: GGDEF domain-containing protein [Candidatus Obscuribacterales bacterium]|nr:GGDEF domain-containing protein [Candidatus Obscuribacterales bacterium]